MAQGGCTQKLSEAEDLYESGRLYEVTKKLNEGNCLHGGKEGFTKEERTRAYRLLALVYIFMDNEPEAEDAVVNLLLVDPEHPGNDPNDPAELKYLFAKYRSKPIFRLGILAGGNFSNVKSLATYMPSSMNPGFDSTGTVISKSFDSDLGFRAGLSFEYMVVKNLELVVRLIYSAHSFDVDYNVISNGTYEPTNSFFLVMKEKQNWLKTPVALRYNIPLGGVTPYVTLGASYDFLLSANMSGNRAGLGTKFLTGLDLKANNMRYTSNWSYMGGLGVKIDFKRTDSFFVEGSYSVGAKNFVKNRYGSEELNFDVSHTDDDKVINSMAISAGYIHSFYNPKKYSDKKLQKVNRKRKER
ncbi:hypothetical protein BFP72_10655 [Reichenbachiella sp. 5M10]|nr:hypothetical protein BFP72_10655 [Reichenbachiella sp. 5M10]